MELRSILTICRTRRYSTILLDLDILVKQLIPLCLLAAAPLLLNAQTVEMIEKDGLYGLFYGDSMIIDYSFQDVTYQYSKTYGAKLNDKWGLLDLQGHVLVPFKYDTLRFNWGEGVIVSQDNKTGVVSVTDSLLLPLIYDNVDYHYLDSTALVKENGRWGILSNGIIDFSENLLIFKSPETKPMFDRCDSPPLNEKGVDKNECSIQKLLKYIYSNIKYPYEAREKGIQGTIVIQFLIEKNGCIKNAKIIREIGGNCGKEALKVIKQMPPWIPATQDGQPVKTQFNMPIKFKLE